MNFARFVFFAAALSLAAPALAQKAGGTLVWGTSQVARHLNPTVQSGFPTAMMGAQIFASPLRFDEKWNPQPIEPGPNYN